MRQFSFLIFRSRRRVTWTGNRLWRDSQVFFFSFSVVFKTVITKGKDYKDVIKLWAGPKLMVFIITLEKGFFYQYLLVFIRKVFLADPRDIELILSSQVYLDKSPEYRFFKPWLGNGLLISSGKLQKILFLIYICYCSYHFRSFAPGCLSL
jgi:hypothetical protein